MKKSVRTKIESWILADLANAPSDYYKLRSRSPPGIDAFDFYCCLENLVIAEKITKLTQTPNPTFELCTVKSDLPF